MNAITDENWPRRPDGTRKTLGEMTHAQQVAVARGAVERLKPEFAANGLSVVVADSIAEERP